MSAGFEVIGSNTSVASDSNTIMDWHWLKPFTEHEWYVTVSDGVRIITGPVWSFTTTGIAGDVTGDCGVDGEDLYAYIQDNGGMSLSDFAADFGTSGCP